MDLATLKDNITSRGADDFVREFVLQGPCLHEQDLVDGDLYYSREANADLARAFTSEFERSAAM